MNFKNNAPDWKNSGTEPPDSFKQTGFSAGYKPPASLFNWFWFTMSACIKELQEKVLSLAGNIDLGNWDNDTSDTVYDGGTYDDIDGEIIDCGGYDNI